MTDKPIPPDDTKEDEFLTSLRLDQSYTDAAVGVRKPLTTVPVRKPTRMEFVRVRPEYSLDCQAVELKEERELYVVRPDVAASIVEFIEPVRLRLCITRQGTIFLWPLKLPREDRRGNAWHQSALKAAELAERNWVRVVSEMSLGAYQPYVAEKDLGEPKWPEESWSVVVKIALRNSVIDTKDHPVLQALLGRA